MNRLSVFLLAAILLIAFLPASGTAQTTPGSRPLLDRPSQDPWVTLHEGYYYHIESQNGALVLRKARNWQDLRNDTGCVVWRAPATGPNSRNVWAPELHRSGLCWCIFFAADDGNNANHRLWVMHSKSPEPVGPYEAPILVNTPHWAIDGSVLDWNNERYLVWSGWPGDSDGQQNLYIAAVREPGVLDTPAVQIAEPTESWERKGMPICEGPAVLKHGNRLFVVYSAGASWTADHCLGMLELQGKDPLDAKAWKKFGPVLARSKQVFGPGHPSFISPSVGKTLMFYNVKTKAEDGWGDRRVRTKEILWTADGWPIFGEP
jgi:GH43 family beta-xylosidase